MQKNQELLYFSNEQDEQFIKIDHLTFDKPNYQKIKETPFWSMNLCFDILAHLKDSSQAYQTLKSTKNDFFTRNAKNNVQDIINSARALKKPKIEGPIEKIQSDLKAKKLENDRRLSRKLYDPLQHRRVLKIDRDWDEVYRERERLLEKLNKEQPEINPAFQYLDKCLRDIKDLFNSKDFITVESEYTKGKCRPFKFIKWAKESGYEIPFDLEIIENEDGNIQWKDSIAFGKLEQTFPKHPTGKDLKDDPLYVAVKVRKSFMNGEIKISNYRTPKQQLTTYVNKKYAHISGVKRTEIVSLVNDGYRHGGKRK